MGRVSNEVDHGTAAQKKLLKLTRKRLERFVTLVPKFLVNDDPDTIHDVRVWSRRLQQTLRPLVKSKTSGRRKLIRTLRRVRQALGECRNLDVNWALARQRAEEAESAVIRDGWWALAAHLEKTRSALLAAARREVETYDLVAFIERARKLIAHADLDADPTTKLEAAVTRSLTEWDDSFGMAEHNGGAENIHALRIATKRLRYRAELLNDSGRTALMPMVKDLKEIQAALGDWHDRSVLAQCAAAFLAEPDPSAHHPDRNSALLGELKKEEQRNNEAVATLLRHASKLRKRWSNGRLSANKRLSAS
jgi:CHAD domain-containing protein